MTNILNSIQEIYEVIQTNGSMPVRVMCSDMKEYICKYSNPTCSQLVKELIASKFLKIWGIHTPEVALVKIHPHHLPQQKLERRQSLRQFEKLCFGSLVMPNTEICTPIQMNARANVQNPGLKEDILKIALFDIWMANDDRTLNNPNLLMMIGSEQEKRFVAIDHAAVFNTGFLDRPLYEQSFEDSLLYAPWIQSMFSNTRQEHLLFENTIQFFHQAVENCKNQLPSIVASIPGEWLAEPEVFQERCSNALFSASWLHSVEDSFRTFAPLS
jgi:hypothetical protein